MAFGANDLFLIQTFDLSACRLRAIFQVCNVHLYFRSPGSPFFNRVLGNQVANDPAKQQYECCASRRVV